MIVIATEDGVRTPEALGVSELGGHAASGAGGRRRGPLGAGGPGGGLAPRDGEWAEVAADTTPGCAACCPGTAARSRERPSAPGPGRPRRGGAGRRLRAGARPRRLVHPLGRTPAVRTIAAGAEGELYVNVHVGGILRSDDDGASWRPTIDIRSDVHEALAVPGRPGLVLAATGVGTATSEDGGASWSFAHDGLAGRYCRAVALAGDTVLLSASNGPRGGDAAIDRRRSERTPLPALHGRLRAQHRHGRLAADGELAAFGTEDGRVFVSRDAGASWTLEASGLPAVQALVVTDQTSDGSPRDQHGCAESTAVPFQRFRDGATGRLLQVCRAEVRQARWALRPKGRQAG